MCSRGVGEVVGGSVVCGKFNESGCGDARMKFTPEMQKPHAFEMNKGKDTFFCGKQEKCDLA